MAPEAAFHASVGSVETPVAPFDGLDKVGAGGGGGIAVTSTLAIVHSALLRYVPGAFVSQLMCGPEA